MIECISYTKSLKQLPKTRGRPKKMQSEQSNQPDLGTPELSFKRACGETAESIDLCLQRNIITESQHRCALHLRWLYTIRYGAPGVTALDLTRGVGIEIHEEDDLEWRKQRELDYSKAISLLRKHRYDKDILPCIIYNEWPIFLLKSRLNQALSSPAKADRIQLLTSRFCEGLELLRELWKRD